MIMTPALGFFYGGLVRRKNLVSTIAQCFAIFAVVSLVWALWGYTLALGPPFNEFIGSLTDFGLNNVGTAPNLGYSSTIPELLYFAFQLKFAAITPALIIGAFAERIRFKALLIYIVLWTTFVYVPIAHWNWGVGGWLKSLGVIDFAGGLVVHTAAGVSAVAAALVIGRRKGVERLDSRPNNIPYVILGASVLWFGWFGFNAGSALAANALAVNALVVTNLAASGAAVSWMLTDWVRKGKPSAVGMAVGAVCGLVALTPGPTCSCASSTSSRQSGSVRLRKTRASTFRDSARKPMLERRTNLIQLTESGSLTNGNLRCNRKVRKNGAIFSALERLIR